MARKTRIENSVRFWILATVTILLAVVGIYSANYLYRSRNISLSPLSPESNPEAAACSNVSGDGECLDASTALFATDPQAGASAADESLLSTGNTYQPQCQKQVFMKVQYDSMQHCKDGRNCEVFGARTAVGWVGGSAGAPRRYYSNGVQIPLTNVNGFWINDMPNAVYRSSAKVNGLGLTRLGNGQVVLTHATPFQMFADYQAANGMFQAINATVLLTGAKTVGFENGDLGVAPDQPLNINKVVAGHGIDAAFDGLISTPPLFTNLLATNGIGSCGGDELKWSNGATSWKQYTRVCWPGDDGTMTLSCPLKPVCKLYPIALNRSNVENVAVGTSIKDVWNGMGSGNFGWLSWTGDGSEGVLSKSLTPPGDSETYVNPNNSSDHKISYGDWIRGNSGVTNSTGVRAALDKMKAQDVIIPVWDEANCVSGSGAQYKTWKYAKVRLTSYNLAGNSSSVESSNSDKVCYERPGKNTITATFKGFVDCAQ